MCAANEYFSNFKIPNLVAPRKIIFFVNLRTIVECN